MKKTTVILMTTLLCAVGCNSDKKSSAPQASSAEKIKQNHKDIFSFNGSKYQFDGRFKLFDIKE